MPDPPSAALESLLTELRRAARASGAPEDFEPTLERPRDPSHGDFATNAALVLAGRLGEAPRAIAERIAAELRPEAAGVSAVEVAGPGFLNFRLAEELYWSGIARLIEADEAWGRSPAEHPLRYNVEFVSANPTGPLHVAHGRGAAIGDAVASLLEWTGHRVSREFYVNDAGRQIDLLAESVEARLLASAGRPAEVPEGGYQGEYVGELAERIAAEEGREALLEMPAEERRTRLRERAVELLRREQEEDLSDFGVAYDVFREESRLYGEGRVEAVLERLRKRELVYESEGALWLRTSARGDEKDRVIVKSDGSYTYLLPDIAYHLDKAERGFERAIDVWGADHHGHLARMEAALALAGCPDEFLEVLLIQLVTVMRGGEELRMSKRAGTFVTLRELFDETGRDVARYFFLMRRAEVPMTFDLDLALDTSEANPVFKVQYAHARMCSVFEKGGVDPAGLSAAAEELERLELDAELAVAKALTRFPEAVRGAAESRAPYQLCTYLEETAGLVNAWYHQGNMDPSLRVLAEGPARPGRLALARAVQITLRNGLRILGIRAPEYMEREGEADS